MKKSIFGSLLAGIAMMGQRAIHPFAATQFSPTRSVTKKRANPAGSKLARKAAKGQIAVMHGGLRFNHVDGIRFRQVTK